MEIIYTLLVLLIIFCLGAIMYIIYYNKLQDCKLKIDESESIIDENLRNKYDLLINISNIINGVIKDSKVSFDELNKLKKEELSNYDLDRKLNEFVILMNTINNDYKELDDNKDYIDNINKLKRIDEELIAAKKFYNTYIGDSNELVRKFPSNIVAKFHNISIKNFFDGKDMNDEIIKDFKL